MVKIPGFRPFSFSPLPPRRIANPRQSASDLCSIFTNSHTFDHKVEQLAAWMEQRCPEQWADLEVWAYTKAAKIHMLTSAGGWKALKGTQNMSTPIDGQSMEAFRIEAVQRLTSLALNAMKTMGFDPPGTHLASGTSGWDSDIDSVYEAPSGMSEEMQIVEKLIIDTVCWRLFQSLPGVLLDTEFYVRHSASTLNTQEQLFTEKGLAGYAMVELNAIALQILRQSNSEHPENCGLTTAGLEWFRQKLIPQLSPTIAEAISRSLIGVIQIARQLRLEVVRAVRRPAVPSSELSPDAFLLAFENTKANTLIKICRYMDKLQAKLISLRPTIFRSDQKLNEERDLIQVQLAALGALRTWFLGESYLTQGAFRDICESPIGQMARRQVERMHTERYLSPNQPIGFHLQTSLITPASALQLASSALENLSMYQSHFHQPSTSELIAQAKYSERIISSVCRLVALSRSSKVLENQSTSIQREITTLSEEAWNLYFQASELETLKRNRILSYSATVALLMEHTGLSEDQIKLVLSRDPQKLLIPLDESILASDRVYILIMALKEVLGVELSPAILSIIKARCGVPKMNFGEHQDETVFIKPDEERFISDCMSRSREITLQKLDLQTSDKILRFNDSIQRLVFTSYAHSVSCKVIPQPGWVYESELDFKALLAYCRET